MVNHFDKNKFEFLCRQLAKRDNLFQSIISQYGYPSLWSREPSFETLVHIILEQQVSLASARAALVKLKEKMDGITPNKLLALSNEELKDCYCSRQKIGYLKNLANSVIDGHLVIESLSNLDDENIRQQLKQIKGIGDWTADVFLMMALHRSNLFPVGDIALVNSVRHEMKDKDLSKEAILLLSKNWEPYRTVAAFLFWHAYIQRKGIVVHP
jgi:DNA-3-methyladenine glycosylase II